MKVSAAMTVLQKLNVPGHVLSALGALRSGTTLPDAPSLVHQQPQPLGQQSQPVQQQQQQPQTQWDTHSPTIQQALPHTLPVVALTPQELHVSRYGLSTQAMSVAQSNTHSAQLQELHGWLTTPIMLSRPAHMSVLADSTWQGYRAEVNQFLGYIRKFQGVQQPGLHHYLNGNLVMHYVSFLRARGVQPIGLSSSVANAQRVVTFLHNTQQLSNTCSSRLSSYQAWLTNLASQLAHNLQGRPPPTLEQLAQQGKWLPPMKLLRLVQQVHKAANMMLPKPVKEGAITIMEAAMCCSLFGYLPPIRPSILISLQQPDYQGPCLWPSCQHKDTCLGNRLEWVDQPAAAASSSNSSSQGLLKLVAPHHKTSKNAKERLISLVLPSELQPMFKYHIRSGLGQIWEPFSFEADDDDEGMELPPTVFISSSTGKALLAQQVSQIWSRVVLPASVSFGPQTARSAFCTLVRQGGQPMDEDAAAHVMGNSLQMWDMVYDRQYKERKAQAAVDSLAEWRQAVLAEAAESVDLDSEEQGDEWLSAESDEIEVISLLSDSSQE